MSTNALELQISSHDSSKIKKYFVPLFFERISDIKVYTLNKLQFIHFFLHNMVKWLQVMIKSKFCQFLFEMFRFRANSKKLVNCPCRKDRPTK